MKQKITLLVLAAICVFTVNAQQVLTQNFNSVSSVLSANNWSRINNSSPAGSNSWFMGNPGVFAAYNGPDSAYFAANYNSTSGSTGTISTWLISPTVTVFDGGVLQFATRTNTSLPQNVAPDRLQVYLSTAGATSNVGSTATSVGTFSTLLVSVNPSLTPTGYPTTWTVYTATLSGITGTVSGRFGFRYFVTSAGPSGVNSSYIGLDGVKFTLPCPNPTLSVASSTTNICSGSIVTLSVSGASTYSWSTGATTSTVNVTPQASTIYTVTGTSTPSCTTSETLAITVTVTPNLAAADVTTCPGTAATLNVSGASSYSWSTGATTNSIVETPTVTTTYSVTGFNGACQSTHLVMVTLGTSLSINATASQPSICSGKSATLTGSGANTYTWLPGATSLTTMVVSVTPTNSTTYTLSGEANGCFGQATVAINLAPLPTITIVSNPPAVSAQGVTVCPGALITLTASGAASYSWASITNTTGVRTITAPATPSTSTSFSIVGTGANGCSRTVSLVVNVDACTGIESILANGVKTAAFPNPFSQELRFTGANGRVEIFNALGQLVLSQSVADQDVLHTEGFTKGVYIMKAFNAGNKLVSTQKLIRN